MMAKYFDDLIELLISEYLNFNPLLGTHLGLNEFDPLMPILVGKDLSML